MLVTENGDGCWRQNMLATTLRRDGFYRFCQQHPLSFNIMMGTNIQKISPILKCCHQHPQIVSNIKSPTYTCHQHLCGPLFSSENNIGYIKVLKIIVWAIFDGQSVHWTLGYLLCEFIWWSRIRNKIAKSNFSQWNNAEINCIFFTFSTQQSIRM